MKKGLKAISDLLLSRRQVIGILPHTRITVQAALHSARLPYRRITVQAALPLGALLHRLLSHWAHHHIGALPYRLLSRVRGSQVILLNCSLAPARPFTSFGTRVCT